MIFIVVLRKFYLLVNPYDSFTFNSTYLLYIFSILIFAFVFGINVGSIKYVRELKK